MTWELTRRRFTRAMNSRYLFNRIPLLHAIIFSIEMVFVGRLVSKYNAYYGARPVLTMMVTNAILGGIADTVAQSITAVRQRALHNKGARSDQLAYELDIKDPVTRRELIPEQLPPSFDFERLTRFMSFGFVMAPLQFKWFGLLSRTFPLTTTSAFVPAMKRVVADQFIFAPFGFVCFYTFMTLAEGGGKRALQQKFRDMYWPTLKANYTVWPAVQVINFRLMPVQFQLPFVSTVGIAWTAYLSLANAAEKAKPESSLEEGNASNIRLE